jgi:hypothetical protein
MGIEYRPLGRNGSSAAETCFEIRDMVKRTAAIAEHFDAARSAGSPVESVDVDGMRWVERRSVDGRQRQLIGENPRAPRPTRSTPPAPPRPTGSPATSPIPRPTRAAGGGSATPRRDAWVAELVARGIRRRAPITHHGRAVPCDVLPMHYPRYLD